MCIFNFWLKSEGGNRLHIKILQFHVDTSLRRAKYRCRCRSHQMFEFTRSLLPLYKFYKWQVVQLSVH